MENTDKRKSLIPGWLIDKELIEVYINLKPKKQTFVQKYVISFNASKACAEAGYSEKTAYSQGQRLLKNVEVSKIIEAYQKHQKDENQDEVEKLRDFLKAVTYSDVLELYDDDGVLKSLKDLSPSIRAAIAAIEFTHNQKGEILTRIKLKDSIRAAELLGKHFGIFKEDNLNVQEKIKGGINLYIQEVEQKADEILERIQSQIKERNDGKY